MICFQVHYHCDIQNDTIEKYDMHILLNGFDQYFDNTLPSIVLRNDLVLRHKARSV